jgi:membrane protease YdiL (CAAX protease family)
MTILYRVFGMILNLAALYLAINMVLSLPVLLSSPLTLLGAFAISSIILYAWFSTKFHRQVLQQQQAVKRSLRDWIRVNGIVSLIYSLFIILGMVMFILNPQIFADQMKQVSPNTPVNVPKALLAILLVYGIVLFIHVIWTFALIKKNIEYFKL